MRSVSEEVSFSENTGYSSSSCSQREETGLKYEGRGEGECMKENEIEERKVI